MLKVAALIIGIDGWDRYTMPLVDSIRKHEPDCKIVVIDNASVTPYPDLPMVHRTERLCYAAAINKAAEIAGDCDWYVVLSNDVLCTGPFVQVLDNLPSNNILGPCLKKIQDRIPYLEGWCVAASGLVWRTLGGWIRTFRCQAGKTLTSA